MRCHPVYFEIRELAKIEYAEKLARDAEKRARGDIGYSCESECGSGFLIIIPMLFCTIMLLTAAVWISSKVWYLIVAAVQSLCSFTSLFC